MDPGPDPDPPERGPLAIAAGMGVPEGPGAVLLIGGAARASGEVARLIPGIEVLAMSPAAQSWKPEPGVSRMVAWPGLPVRSGRVRGVALDVGAWPDWGSEVKRVLVPGGRAVLLGPVVADAPWSDDEALALLLSDGDVAVVAVG
ncbi:MAG: hypothetical protein HKO53_13040 [Gemmatimonadetes bacterium]|nr:hypothetical protein [Gemmatimonadota bacterium]